MHRLALILGCFLLAIVLLDAFQTIILPRRPVGRFRITRLFFLLTWQPWSALARVCAKARRRDQFLSIYGPMALLLLFFVWATLLVGAYALVYLGLKVPFADPTHPGTLLQQLRSCMYVSGTTLFTLGLGDVQPVSHAARALIVLEAGTGLGFIALVIGYVPVLYTAFSAREVSVALLDARAGSPPTATELLLRHSFDGGHEALATLLSEWERWAGTMLESHVSYPILCYYRSQHDNQSWLSAITAILDACSLIITTVEGPSTRQAQLTFAIARHTLVDLGHVFHLESVEQRYKQQLPNRLPNDEFAHMCEQLSRAGYSLCDSDDTCNRLTTMRTLYEPHAQAMADYLGLELPRWVAPPATKADNWNVVAKLRKPSAMGESITIHISKQAAAAQLHDDTAHPL